MSHVPDDVKHVFEKEAAEDANALPTLEPLEESAIRRHDGKLVGAVYYCPDYECNAYFSKRWDGGPNNQKYRKGNAYAIDVCIIEELRDEWDVEKVFIGLRRAKNVLEFNFEQYENGEYIEYESPQQYDSIENCQAKWEDALDSIVAE